MLKWITLEQAIQQGNIKKGDYIGYFPEHATNVASHSETGGVRISTLETEQLGYRLAYITEKKKIVIISDKLTSQTLHLYGKKGRKHGPNTLLKVCNTLFSNATLGAVAYFMTEEDFKKLPKKLRYAKNWEKSFIQSIFGPGAVCTNYLSEEYLNNDSMSLKLRPLVSLEPSIFVGVGDNFYNGSSQERSFRISLIDRSTHYLENILLP